MRQYTNPECFQQHGLQLVEVCTCMRTCSVCTLYAQSLSSSPPSTIYFSFFRFGLGGWSPPPTVHVITLGVCTHIVYYMTSLLIFLCCGNYILYSIYTSHRALQSNEETKSTFVTHFTSCLPFISVEAVYAVYLELSRKLCSTRIQEFLDSTRPMQSAKVGKVHLKVRTLEIIYFHSM